MTLIKRFGAVLFLLTIVIPFTASTATKPSGAKGCTNKEFWSPENECCLPVGGPPSPPPPPKGSDCPPTSHYWGTRQGCCVPRHEPPPQGPPPQCSHGWVWNPAVRKCLPTPTPPSPPPSKPSKYPGNGNGQNGGGGYGQNGGGGYGQNGGGGYGHNGGNGHNQKRASQLKSRSAKLCPVGLDACPILAAKSGDYECLDTSTELESCGGCASLGGGQDCTAISGAWNVGCEEGRCAVYTCAGGFKRAQDGKSCIPL